MEVTSQLMAMPLLALKKELPLHQERDIVASSEFGRSGTITINAPESNAERDLRLGAPDPESPQAGEFLEAVCPNPDNRYGLKTFRYIGMGVPRGPDNYSDPGKDPSALDRTIRKARIRQRVREDLRNGGDGKIDPDTIPPDPRLLKIDYPPLDQPQNEQHRRDIEDTLRQKQERSKGRGNALPVQGERPGAPTTNTNTNTVEGYSPPVITQFPFTKPQMRVIHAKTNTVPELPEITIDSDPGPSSNAIQINPDGSVYLVNVAQIDHPSEQMCVRRN